MRQKSLSRTEYRIQKYNYRRCSSSYRDIKMYRICRLVTTGFCACPPRLSSSKLNYPWSTHYYATALHIYKDRLNHDRYARLYVNRGERCWDWAVHSLIRVAPVSACKPSGTGTIVLNRFSITHWSMPARKDVWLHVRERSILRDKQK